MGRRRGSTVKLQRFGNLDRQEVDIILRLVLGAPEPVPYDRTVRLSTGEWSPPGTVGHMVCDLRRKIGPGLIETVTGSGYRASAELVDIVSHLIGAVLCAG